MIQVVNYQELTGLCDGLTNNKSTDFHAFLLGSGDTLTDVARGAKMSPLPDNPMFLGVGVQSYPAELSFDG